MSTSPADKSQLVMMHDDLFVPRTRTTRPWRRSFFITAPVVWNSLPLHLRYPSISRSQFRAGLKTHLYRLHGLSLTFPLRTIEVIKTELKTELNCHRSYWTRCTSTSLASTWFAVAGQRRWFDDLKTSTRHNWRLLSSLRLSLPPSPPTRTNSYVYRLD